MKFILYKGKEPIAEAVDIGGTLHVHYYDSRGSFQYTFGTWPKLKYKKVTEHNCESYKVYCHNDYFCDKCGKRC